MGVKQERRSIKLLFTEQHSW